MPSLIALMLVITVFSTKGAAIIINHASIGQVATVPGEIMAQAGRLTWFFAHASVGDNIMDGITDWHTADPIRFPLQRVGYSWPAAPPKETPPGAICDHMRWNPGWQAKISMFETNIAWYWHAPRIQVAMNKLGYTDPDADIEVYLASMQAIEAQNPAVAFVYCTLPSTVSGDRFEVKRIAFSQKVRDFVAANNRILLDVADIENHAPDGQPATFVFDGITYPRMYDGYTVTGGHLDAPGNVGRQRVALGIYALSAALFTTDRNGDGISDGDNLMAGQSPTAPPAQQMPVITAQPGGLAVDLLQPAAFAVVATGKPAPTYQWRKGGIEIDGATAASHHIAGAQIGDAGDYDVVVRNAVGSLISGTATLVVRAAAPRLITQPAAQIVTQGNTAIFTMEAAGIPAPAYQWRRNLVNIDGATHATHTIANAQPADEGSFDVIVSNALGNLVSDVATLTVQTAPVISVQPGELTVDLLQPAAFAVVATGKPAPTYQWRKGGIEIAGATAASHHIAGAQIGDAGDYDVVVRNAVGTLISGVATLVVRAAAPRLITQPAAQIVTQGNTAIFTMEAAGIPAPAYQWRRNLVNIDGATHATHTIANAQPADEGSFDVIVSNAVGSLISDAATLTVEAVPVITAQPGGLAVDLLQPATFTVVATGKPAPTYQWRKGGIEIVGATAASFHIAGAQIGDAGDYDVVVRNAVGSLISGTATLVVRAAAPRIITQPAAQIVTQGNTAIFTMEAAGIPAPAYQWRRNLVNIDGATHATHTIANAQPADEGSFDVIVSNALGNLVSDAATLTVQTAPVISVQPGELTVDLLQPATFTVVATGKPAPTYQWRKGGIEIVGATASSFHLASVQIGDAGDYDAVVKNTVGSLISGVARLTVNSSPWLSLDPSVETGTTLVLIHATVNPRNAGEITGAIRWIAPDNTARHQSIGVIPNRATPTNFPILLTSLAPNTTYLCRLIGSNSTGEVQSEPITVTTRQEARVTAGLYLTGRPRGESVAISTVNLLAAARGTPPLTLEWIPDFSTAGARLARESAGIWCPAADNPDLTDTLYYVIKDGTGEISGSWISLFPIPPAGSDPALFRNILGARLLPTGEMEIFYVGIPGHAYTLQCRPMVGPGDWRNLATTIAPNPGTIRFAESPATRFEYYRVIEP